MTKRTAIAVAWVAGTTLPAVAAIVLVFGCCVLPFHSYIHKAMPLCHVAMGIISGEHDGQRDAAANGTLPAREKQEPVKRLVTDVLRPFHPAPLSLTHHTATPLDTTAYRSYIALGALRCDQDVGIYLLTAAFLI